MKSWEKRLDLRPKRRRLPGVALEAALPLAGSPGEDQNREVIADGLRNIWICELGRQAVDGPFEDFVNRISQSRIANGGLQVVYHSPSRGGWNLDGRVPCARRADRELSDYPRYDNPYLQAEFGTNWYDIRLAGQQMVLDFETARDGR